MRAHAEPRAFDRWLAVAILTAAAAFLGCWIGIGLAVYDIVP